MYERARLFIGARSHAYRMVFHPDNVFTKTVLKDLAQFCRATETTFNQDPRVHAVLEGRREVWLRISEHLHLTPDELYKKLGGKD